MTIRPDAPGPNPILADAARRQEQRDVFALPAARLPFRIAGGAVAALCLLAIWLKVRAAVNGEIGWWDLIDADYGMLLATLAMALTFGILAVSGKVPKPIWNLFRRAFGGVD